MMATLWEREAGFRLRIALVAVLLLVSSGARGFVLVLDAGHGGNDPGAVGKYSKEKDINLRVTLRVGQLVEQNCKDVKVVYTRKTDVFVPLDDRATIANNAKADLFISIHTNSLPKGRVAYGSETYSLGMARAEENLAVAKRENSVILYEQDYEERYSSFNPNSSESYIIFEFIQDSYMKQSVDLAQAIQKHYKTAGRQDKGVHQAGFLVLRKTSMPSVLTELGFISTPAEETYLNSAAGVEQLAMSIYRGFLDYRKAYGGTVTKAQFEAAASQPVAAAPVVANEVKEESTSVESGVVFKVQIRASATKLKAGSAELKGVDADYYEEGGMYKYTAGSTGSYSEIVSLQKELRSKFPDCFVIAFRDGAKISVQEARKASGQ